MTNDKTQPADDSGRYRLVIEGDEALMRQIAEAVELQGRLHLGQFEEIFRTLEYGVVDRARRDGLPVSEGACHPEASKMVRQNAAARFDALMRLRDTLTPLWAKARREYDAAFHAPPLAELSPHLSRRERRAYTLWKWLEHHLLHLRRTDENDELLRGTVDYYPPLIHQADVTVTLEKVP